MAIEPTTQPIRPRIRIAPLRLLIPYLKPYGLRTFGAAAALLTAAGLLLTLGQGLRRLIDLGFATGDTSHLDHAALAMVGIVAALAFATSARFYLVSWLGERVAADLRRDMFDRVISLSPAFFETARVGDLLTRLTADITVLQTLIGSAISQWLRNAILLLGAFAMLLFTSPKLAGIVLLVVPLVVVPLVLFGRRERRLSRVAQDRVADIGSYAEETINALRTVQAFTHEPVDRARFAAEVERSVGAALRRVRTRATQILIVILLGFGAIVFSLWVGGRDVISGHMTGGDLSAFVFYAVLTATSGAQMSELFGELQRAAGAADRLRELLNERPTITRSGKAAPSAATAGGKGRVRRGDVQLPGPAAYRRAGGFFLAVAPGETVALVGPSGAGKTTVLQLLLRFYDPERGVIRIDGVDIARADPAEVRRRIGIVPQDPVIFGTTALENIRYGRPDATEEEIRAAGKAAPCGLPRSAAGRLRHVSWARKASGCRAASASASPSPARSCAIRRCCCWMRRPARWMRSRNRRCSRRWRRCRADRTTIVIAHRLATVRGADRIVVMEAGRVVATGTHDSLIREGGIYARLARLQFSVDA